MKNIKFDKQSIIILAILGVGLIATLLIAQKTQVFRSRASEVNETIDITGEGVEYTGNNTYKTNSLDLNISIKNLQK
ncbi:MAG: hypothetical protein HYT83_03705 [Candidatus Levybacteria bacterium]|nr:hypothetical protein [Candidatus Levybacteria bacterium]